MWVVRHNEWKGNGWYRVYRNTDQPDDPAHWVAEPIPCQEYAAAGITYQSVLDSLLRQNWSPVDARQVAEATKRIIDACGRPGEVAPPLPTPPGGQPPVRAPLPKKETFDVWENFREWASTPVQFGPGQPLAFGNVVITNGMWFFPVVLLGGYVAAQAIFGGPRI